MASPGGGADVEIDAIDIAFGIQVNYHPSQYRRQGRAAEQGAAAHNFSIDALDISVDLAAGETKEVIINAAPGRYEFYFSRPATRKPAWPAR